MDEMQDRPEDDSTATKNNLLSIREKIYEKRRAYEESLGIFTHDPSTQAKMNAYFTESCQSFEPDFDNPALPSMEETVICKNCVHCQDPRPWHKRRLARASINIVLCTAAPRIPAVNSVSGRHGFVSLYQTPSQAGPRPFEFCRFENANGTCTKFKPKKKDVRV